MTPAQEALCRDLASTPAQIVDAARDHAESSMPLVAGEWSARDVTLHLAVVEVGVWHVRLDALETGSFPEWPWVEPDRWSLPEGSGFEAAVDVFSAHRAATVRRLEELDQTGWQRRGRHATFGVLDVAALMRIALDHDEEHLRQITG